MPENRKEEPKQARQTKTGRGRRCQTRPPPQTSLPSLLFTVVNHAPELPANPSLNAAPDPVCLPSSPPGHTALPSVATPANQTPPRSRRSSALPHYFVPHHRQFIAMSRPQDRGRIARSGLAIWDCRCALGRAGAGVVALPDRAESRHHPRRRTGTLGRRMEAGRAGCTCGFNLEGNVFQTFNLCQPATVSAHGTTSAALPASRKAT